MGTMQSSLRRLTQGWWAGLLRLAAPMAVAVIVSAGGGTAAAAPINLAALGLVAAPAPFETENSVTSLFGGAAFSSDNLSAPGSMSFAVAGSPPFGPTDFGLSAFPTAGSGTLTGNSSAVGWDLDLVEVLIAVDTNTGAFSGVADLVLVSISGSFGTDPLGLGGNAPTLANFVPSSVSFTNINPIPLPAALPVFALLLGGVCWMAGRPR